MISDQLKACETVESQPTRNAFLWFLGLIALITLGLVVYSQTMSFVWDEGFHILAAQLIDRGETPYLDFCFPQTPLNAYWNAALMAVFGESWHVTHFAAALEVAGAVYLISDYILRRFPIMRWRLALAATVACFVGMNVVAVEFGTVSQAYGIGMLLSVSAFRIAVEAVNRKRVFFPFAAGLLISAAAGCTLLTAPMVLVLLLWMLFCNQIGDRWGKFTASLVGAVVPFIPVLLLFSESPRQVFFNIVQYQAIFRRVKWNGATPHDVDVLSAWVADSQSLLLTVFAIAGLLFIVRSGYWNRVLRREYYLCAWLAGLSALYISTAHPTFQRYFVFVIPFASVLAAAGLYWAGSRLSSPDRPLWPTLIVSSILALSLGRGIFGDRDSTMWKDYEAIAKKIRQITRPGQSVYADEHVYFLNKWLPPSGMEFSYSHKLDLPKDQEALYHVISESELNEQVKQGKFAVVESCNDDRIDDMKLNDLFSKKTDDGDCSTYWAEKKKASGS